MKILRILAGTAFISVIIATGSVEAKDGGDDCADGKAALEGFYVSAGGGYSSQKSTVDIEEIGDCLSPAVLAGTPGGFDATSALCIGNGYYVTGDATSGLTSSKRIHIRGAERKTNKIEGAVALGSGRFVGNFYLGAEAGLEVGKNGGAKDETTVIPCELVGRAAPPLEACYILKNNGVIPCLRFRLGCFSSSLNGMFYALIGVNRVKATINGYDKYTGSGFSLTKLTPSIGFGFEKVIKNKMSIKFEGDYKLKSGKIGRLLKMNRNGSSTFVKPKIRTAGFAVRIMANWHF